MMLRSYTSLQAYLSQILSLFALEVSVQKVLVLRRSLVSLLLAISASSLLAVLRSERRGLRLENVGVNSDGPIRD